MPTPQKHQGTGKRYAPGPVPQRRVSPSLTSWAISPITEEEEECNGNSGEGHKGHAKRMALLGASLLLSLMSSAPHSHIGWGRVGITGNAQCCLLKAQSGIKFTSQFLFCSLLLTVESYR